MIMVITRLWRALRSGPNRHFHVLSKWHRTDGIEMTSKLKEGKKEGFSNTSTGMENKNTMYTYTTV